MAGKSQRAERTFPKHMHVHTRVQARAILGSVGPPPGLVTRTLSCDQSMKGWRPWTFLGRAAVPTPRAWVCRHPPRTPSHGPPSAHH
eukprot:366351-Chlamydomonas_euryale.AAC.17